MLVLSGYLLAQYAREWPLAPASTITFEQSWDEVDGDSASSTELYALLSVLSGLPLRRDIGLTGAVPQYGDVRAVGGVTRKIEGFFGVCSQRGLTGSQEIPIPSANVQHLMIAEPVVEAVRQGRFHIWAVDHIDQGIEMLTGRNAAKRNVRGQFPKLGVQARVEDQLRRYGEHGRADGSPAQSTPEAANGHRRTKTGTAERS